MSLVYRIASLCFIFLLSYASGGRCYLLTFTSWFLGTYVCKSFPDSSNISQSLISYDVFIHCVVNIPILIYKSHMRVLISFCGRLSKMICNLSQKLLLWCHCFHLSSHTIVWCSFGSVSCLSLWKLWLSVPRASYPISALSELFWQHQCCSVGVWVCPLRVLNITASHRSLVASALIPSIVSCLFLFKVTL